MSQPQDNSIQNNLRRLLKSIKDYFVQLFDIQEDTDKEGTIESIKKYIVIKGYNVWILICAAMIASIGLDMNSAAVIIGAMLISPLMSPILGIGLGIGINDRETISLAFQNFLVATIASIITSYIYFLISPFGEETQEIMARTRPTLLDVGVAFFGGIAGIVAGSHKDKTNALPGVAIATALMPPLCTVGYGLAKQKWMIAQDAFYLFLINAVIISCVTLVFVRLLRFPIKEYVSPKARFRYNSLIFIFVIIFILPSGAILLNRIHDFRIEQEINRFVDTEVNVEDYRTVLRRPTWEQNDSIKELHIFVGGEVIPSDSIEYLQKKLTKKYPLLHDFEVDFIQTRLSQEEKDELLTEVSSQKDEIKLEVLKVLEEYNTRVEELANFKATAESLSKDTIIFQSLKKEIGAIYPETEVLFKNALPHKYLDKDSVIQPITIHYLTLDWKKEAQYDADQILNMEKRIKRYAITRFGFDSLVVVRQKPLPSESSSKKKKRRR